MNFKPLIFWICLVISTNALLAQIEIECLKFRTNTGESFVDIVIDIPGVNCNYIKSDESWQSSTLITVIAEKAGEVSQFKKTELLSPEIVDSAEAHSINQLHLERLALGVGRYKISIKVDAKKAHEFVQNVEISVPGSPEISSVLLVEAYAPATESDSSKFFRSGFEMIPIAGNEISPTAEKLRIYAELYDINDVVGNDSLFLVVFGLTNSNGILDPQNTRYKRFNAKQVTPIFETLPVSPTTPPLSGGQIVIQVKTRDGHLICETSTPIERKSFKSSITHDYVSFGDEFDNVQKLYRHLEDHLPLASPSQQHTIGKTLKGQQDLNVLRGFLEQFWIKKSPENPEKAWRAYCEEITVVDSVFGGCRGGHGADTDMGYVYLKYGRPNTIVKRHHDTDYYPYEIWHYHHTNGFTNRRFLFFAPHVVLECMEILQSDMPGEIQNQDWLQLLKSRENRVKVIDSQLNRLNPRDTYSREEPEDLYFNPR